MAIFPEGQEVQSAASQEYSTVDVAGQTSGGPSSAAEPHPASSIAADTADRRPAEWCPGPHAGRAGPPAGVPVHPGDARPPTAAAWPDRRCNGPCPVPEDDGRSPPGTGQVPGMLLEVERVRLRQHRLHRGVRPVRPEGTGYSSEVCATFPAGRMPVRTASSSAVAMWSIVSNQPKIRSMLFS